MKRNRVIPFLLAGALALVAVLGVFTYQTVSAEDATPTPDTPETAAPGFGKALRGGLRGGGYTEQDLADALGITVDELQQAKEDALNQALEQAVSQGLITQAQADAIRERGGPRFHFGGRWLGENGMDPQAFLADALGITVDELEAAYQEAFIAGINRAAENGRITQEQADLILGRRALFANERFQSSMRTAFEAAVQQAVKDGVITQAQADQILANSPAFEFRGRGFGGPAFSGRGFGRGGAHGGWLPGAPSLAPEGDA